METAMTYYDTKGTSVVRVCETGHVLDVYRRCKTRQDADKLADDLNYEDSMSPDQRKAIGRWSSADEADFQRREELRIANEA